jgi:hypothetical protein
MDKELKKEDYPPPPPGLTRVGARGDEDQQQMDPRQLQLYYMSMFRQPQRPPFGFRGPSVPKPLGKSHPWLFKMGGTGFALLALVFIFYGVQSWIMFPIWFVLMFESEAITIININIFLYFFLIFVFLFIIFGYFGLLKNLGSKYSITPLIFLTLTLLIFVVLAMMLVEAAEAYETYSDYEDYEDDDYYYYDTYNDWNNFFYVAHILSNIFIGTTMILFSISFLQWKHVNKYPKLCSAAGIMGIVCGTLTLFTFMEFMGAVYFYGGITFFLMAIAFFNFPVLDKEERPLFVAAKQKEDMEARFSENPQLGLAYHFQAQMPQYYMHPQMRAMYPEQMGRQNPFVSKDPYRDIQKFAENLKQA